MWKLTVHIGQDHDIFQFTGHERQCHQGSRHSEYIKKYDCFSGSGWHACNNRVKTCQVGAFALSGGYYPDIILLHVKKAVLNAYMW